MSVRSRSPLRIAGATISSGFAGTGESRWTRGGDAVDARLSGISVDTQVVSGAGRLNTVTRLTIGPLTSGVGSVIFYDGIIATSGGPFATSGHKALYTLVQSMVVVSGSSTMGSQVSVPVAVDMPFLSGLIVAPLMGSGTFGFCASFTPETAPTTDPG